jgi:hypothetical protein
VNWDKKLPRPIALEGGRKLITLKDAGDLIGSFNVVRKDAALEHAIELLMRAAETGKKADVAAAAHQLRIVLNMRPLMAD